MTALTAEQALAAWANIETNPGVAVNDIDPIGDTIAPPSARVAGRAPYRLYRPFSEAATAFAREAQDSKRIYLGIDQFDREMRGIGAGHVCTFIGFSHGGKTLLFLHALRQNRDKRVAMFIPDEPAPLVLAKLASMHSGVPARELEQRVASYDQEAIDLLQHVATDQFPNLAVFDKPLIPSDMEQAWEEYTDVHGGPPELVVVDYVELVQAGETVPQKFDFLKAFGSRHEVPMVLIHQTSRSAGAEGKKLTISSGAYGGEQHSTFVIGVRRRKSGLMAELAEQEDKFARTANEKAAEAIVQLKHDLAIHEYTVTANLVKNKRPGGGLVDDIDFELETATGRIYPLADGELPQQYLNQHRPPKHSAPVPAPYVDETIPNWGSDGDYDNPEYPQGDF